MSERKPQIGDVVIYKDHAGDRLAAIVTGIPKRPGTLRRGSWGTGYPRLGGDAEEQAQVHDGLCVNLCVFDNGETPKGRAETEQVWCVCHGDAPFRWQWKP